MYSRTLSFNFGARSYGGSTTSVSHFTPETEAGTHCTEGWVGPRSVWAGAENLASTGLQSRTVKHVAIRYPGPLKQKNLNFNTLTDVMPVTVAVRHKTYVCGRSSAEIVGSNPTEVMYICLL
jgi:hypothetical protein